jgi:hypothetical protein
MPLLDSYGMPVMSDTDGDSMLWAGLMVAVGDHRPIQGIKMCQTPDGRLWRAPSRVNNQLENSFSRDMALGFILYVQATGDYEMADKWTAYIKKTQGLFPANESTDTRHIVTPALWWTMSYAGIKVPLIYRLTRFLLKPYNQLEFRFTPRGYQTHLKAVQALILAIYHKKRDKKFGKMLSKREPLNPFYMWLAGRSADAMSQNEFFKYEHDLNPGDGTQWGYQRDDGEEAWRDSCGWDFLFIEMLCNLSLP